MAKKQFYREVKFSPVAYKPRVREAGKGGKGRTICGYAIVWNKESQILCDWCDYYREIIKPQAVDEKTIRSYDIHFTAFHNREKLLARQHPGGTGTLKLKVDAVGVYYEFEAPDSATGNDILVAVQRGDLQNASFTFDISTTVQTITRGADGVELHTITKLGTISELTIALNPAYQDTTASAREKREREIIKAQIAAAQRDREMQIMELELKGKIADLEHKRLFGV